MLSEYDIIPRKTIGRVLLLGVVSVLILLGTHTHLLSMVAFVICAFIIVFDKTSFSLFMMTYLMMLAHIFKISPTGMSYFTFLVFLYIGVKLFEDRKILWIVILFIIFVLTVQIVRSEFKLNDDLKLFGNILFIGYSLGDIYTFSDTDKEKLCITYISAVIVSSVMRFFDSDFFRISSYTNELNTEGYGAGVESIVRFSGLDEDPNYYSVNLLVALCLIVILYYRGRTSKVFCGLSAAAILYFGTLTYSKSFLLILMIPLFMFLYANHRIGRYDIQVISIALLAAAVLIVLSINPDYLTNMQRRVESRDSITTGRTELWMAYLNYIYENPDVMLFGIGIGGGAMFGNVVHNFYIECLYHLGIIGSFLFIVSIVSSFTPYRIIKKTNLLNYSVLLCILSAYFFLCQLHGFEFPMHFMLAFMVLFQWDLSKEENAENSVICKPMLPDFNDKAIKTIQSVEEQ